jgi:hypothetical protein
VSGFDEGHRAFLDEQDEKKRVGVLVDSVAIVAVGDRYSLADKHDCSVSVLLIDFLEDRERIFDVAIELLQHSFLKPHW